MRHGTANRRSRNNRNNNNNRSKGGPNRAHVYDSNGPEVRIRGTAHQICEKYEALAKDARAVGDAVLAESYLQHAEHYQRIITEINAQSAAYNASRQMDDDTVDEAAGNRNAMTPKKQAQNDDLSLPSSILGDKVNVKYQSSVRAMEDA